MERERLDRKNGPRARVSPLASKAADPMDSFVIQLEGDPKKNLFHQKHKKAMCSSSGDSPFHMIIRVEFMAEE